MINEMKTQIFAFCLLMSIGSGSAQQTQMMFGDSTRLGRPFAKDPHVVKTGENYLMYYSIPANATSNGWGIGIARSTDLINWDKVGEVVPDPQSPHESKGICAPGAWVEEGVIHLFYQTYGNGSNDAICHAVSADGINFTRDKSNPVFRPTGGWNCGRAIDAEVCRFKDQYFLYFATRDPNYRIQQQGVAVARPGEGFGRTAWSEPLQGPILSPVLPWEGECVEGASVVEKEGRLYMFYAGAYNNSPQQIGVAVSDDGIAWKRLFDEPFVTNGVPGSWNSSESGHPHLFLDTDGRTYLFYQGNNDNGKTWFITQREVLWKDSIPYLTLK